MEGAGKVQAPGTFVMSLIQSDAVVVDLLESPSYGFHLLFCVP